MRRTAPCVGLLYGVLVMWFWEQFEQGLRAVIPNRPWYGHKENVSFEDIVRTARFALRATPLLDLVAEFAPLHHAHDGRAAPISSQRQAA